MGSLLYSTGRSRGPEYHVESGSDMGGLSGSDRGKAYSGKGGRYNNLSSGGYKKFSDGHEEEEEEEGGHLTGSSTAHLTKADGRAAEFKTSSVSGGRYGSAEVIRKTTDVDVEMAPLPPAKVHLR